MRSPSDDQHNHAQADEAWAQLGGASYMLGRIRSIKPELFMDEDLAALPVEARYLLIGLHCHADRAGRFEWRPARLRALIYPFEQSLDVAALLEQLQAARFLLRYEADGAVFGYVRHWTKQQVINNRERESELPPPPDDADAAGDRPAADPQAPVSTEAKKATKKKAAPDPGPLFETAVFYVNTGEEWRAPIKLVDTLRAAYPGVDVEAELLKAAAWTLANSSTRKTKNGMASFLQRWVARAQDDAARKRPAAATGKGSQVVSRFSPIEPNFEETGS